MRFRLLTIFVLLASLAGTTAHAALRDDADWTEHYFTSSDGVTRLHADVLRPKGMADDVKTPVILTVSPYLNHNGSTSDTDPNGVGPNPRFYDFLDLTRVLEDGYTYVMVDLPGFGGSGGCNDWGGVREQAGVRAAVEWAAEQPWSTGKVALLGKSYDGWTGLMGVAQQPKGLAAVIAQEPVYSGYRYMYMNGIRRPNFYGTMLGFQQYDAKLGRMSDTPEYHLNGAPQAWCYPVNMAGTLGDHNESGPYWAERNLIPTAVGKTTPVFMTQGFLERNTRSDAAFQYFNGLAGEHNRAWYCQCDHFRGWETDSDGVYQMGRDTYIEELMRFLELHLKGIEPEIEDPAIEVQDILGRVRGEESWPPADSVLYETELRAGTYTDSGSGNGLRPSATQGIWSVSPALEHEVWFSGEPVINVSVDAPPNSNLVANVYDIAPDGALRMISRGAQLLHGTGVRNFSFSMYGQDWPIEAGHRIGVLLSSANTEEFRHVATRATVTIRNAKVALPFLTYDRTEFLDRSNIPPRLKSFLDGEAAVLGPDVISGAETPFVLPGPLQPPISSEEDG